MSLDRTSFDRIIYFMSLDRTSFYWSILHSIGLYPYPSCHWIGLHVIATHHSVKNHIWVIESKLMSLDRRPFDQTLYIRLPLDWIELHIIGSETSFHRASSLLKKVCLPECFSDYFPHGCSSSAVFCCVKILDWDGQLNEKNRDFTPWGGWPPGKK